MADADGITHTTLKLNGINIHVAEKGTGPVVLFVHGFPELWYSWRHQLLALAARGYRAVAPDMRGYGDTDAPEEASEYTFFHTVGDLVALMDALGEERVFVVGHDWGALVAWLLCLMRPDKVKALVNLSVPFGVLGRLSPERSPVDELRAFYGEDYYTCRFQVPGDMEADIAESGGAHKFLTKVFQDQTPDPWMFPKGKWFEETLPHPTWMSKQEFNHYVTKFDQTGFTGGFNYYRAIKLSWPLVGPWNGAKVMVPTKFVVGERDLVYHMPGVQDYVNKGEMHKDVPLLKEVVVLQGVGHFLQQEKPDEINNHIYDFIKQF